MKAAVIGTGPLGLLAAKNLKEQGFDVTAFERRGYLGGLWKHTTENIISVNPNTVFNSSRYRCAFTDYPFPDDVDDFPTCQQSKRPVTAVFVTRTRSDMRSCVPETDCATLSGLHHAH